MNANGNKKNRFLSRLFASIRVYSRLKRKTADEHEVIKREPLMNANEREWIRKGSANERQ